jgi:Ca-activated chloride channel family protein
VSFEEKSEGTARLFVERIWAQRRIGDLIDQIQLYGQNKELVEEVVRLSTRYGIITEYTSFLIRDEVSLKDLSGNLRRGAEELRKLQQDTGVAGNARAEDKKGRQVGAQEQAAQRYKDADGRDVEVKVVQNVDRRTFYLKNKVWQESEAAEKADVTVQFYSDEFFKLLEENPELNKVATLDADVVLKVGDRNVRLAK